MCVTPPHTVLRLEREVSFLESVGAAVKCWLEGEQPVPPEQRTEFSRSNPWPSPRLQSLTPSVGS